MQMGAMPGENDVASVGEVVGETLAKFRTTQMKVPDAFVDPTVPFVDPPCPRRILAQGFFGSHGSVQGSGNYNSIIFSKPDRKSDPPNPLQKMGRI